MKSRLIAMAWFAAGAVSVFILQRQKVVVAITPRPLLYLVADTQQEAERIPLGLTRVSGSEEIEAGDTVSRQYGLSSRRSSDPDKEFANFENSQSRKSSKTPFVNELANQAHFGRFACGKKTI